MFVFHGARPRTQFFPFTAVKAPFRFWTITAVYYAVSVPNFTCKITQSWALIRYLPCGSAQCRVWNMQLQPQTVRFKVCCLYFWHIFVSQHVCTYNRYHWIEE